MSAAIAGDGSYCALAWATAPAGRRTGFGTLD
jgi:hypothetical protein